MKKLVIFYLTTFLFSIVVFTVNAQDIVFKKDGTRIKGDAIVYFNEQNDFVEINSQKISSLHIDMISFQDGREMVPASLYYFDENGNIERKKTALLTYLIKGDVDLFEYEGNAFSYALQVEEKFFSLQNFSLHFDTYNVKNYKIVLLEQLQECLSRRKIFSSDFNKESLTNHIESYNTCRKNRFRYITDRKGNFRHQSFSFSVGLNTASHSLSARVPADETGPFFGVNRVDQSNVSSSGLLLSVAYEVNLGKSKNFYFKLRGGYKNYNFPVTTIEREANVKNLASSEIFLSPGFKLKLIPTRKLSPFISVGGFVWIYLKQDDLYSDFSSQYPVLDSGFMQESGVGYLISPGLNYRINDSITFGISGTFFKKTIDDIYTYKLNSSRKYLWDDSLTDNLTFSLGISYEIFKTKLK